MVSLDKCQEWNLTLSQLHADHNHLLLKYAEAETVIDQLRFGSSQVRCKHGELCVLCNSNESASSNSPKRCSDEAEENFMECYDIECRNQISGLNNSAFSEVTPLKPTRGLESSHHNGCKEFLYMDARSNGQTVTEGWNESMFNTSSGEVVQDGSARQLYQASDDCEIDWLEVMNDILKPSLSQDDTNDAASKYYQHKPDQEIGSGKADESAIHSTCKMRDKVESTMLQAPITVLPINETSTLNDSKQANETVCSNPTSKTMLQLSSKPLDPIQQKQQFCQANPNCHLILQASCPVKKQFKMQCGSSSGDQLFTDEWNPSSQSLNAVSSHTKSVMTDTVRKLPLPDHLNSASAISLECKLEILEALKRACKMSGNIDKESRRMLMFVQHFES